MLRSRSRSDNQPQPWKGAGQEDFSFSSPYVRPTTAATASECPLNPFSLFAFSAFLPHVAVGFSSSMFPGRRPCHLGAPLRRKGIGSRWHGMATHHTHGHAVATAAVVFFLVDLPCSVPEAAVAPTDRTAMLAPAFL